MMFLNIGQSRPLFVYYRPFHIELKIQIEALILCLGFEPGAGGW